MNCVINLYIRISCFYCVIIIFKFDASGLGQTPMPFIDLYTDRRYNTWLHSTLITLLMYTVISERSVLLHRHSAFSQNTFNNVFLLCLLPLDGQRNKQDISVSVPVWFLK